MQGKTWISFKKGDIFFWGCINTGQGQAPNSANDNHHDPGKSSDPQSGTLQEDLNSKWW